MSDIEMIHLQSRGAAPVYYSSAISDTKSGSDHSPDRKRADEELDDIELTPGSSVPLLVPFETCQGSRGSFLDSAWQWALILLVPTISIAYLTFCYVVHYRAVPANVSGLATDSMTLITNVGSAITTVNIIIISLALFPLKALLYELKSEEFFRLLTARRNSRGVELTAVNGISNSSYGFSESVMAVINRHCSLYYIMAFVAAVCVWAVSTLAPAALSVQPILIDDTIMAFPVGAIPPLALYQPVAGGQTVLPSNFNPEPGYSAAITWAEREIGLSYSFSVLDDPQGQYAGFVVPSPSSFNSSIDARWLTDVIGLNPYCTWAQPVNLTKTSLNYTMNSTDVPVTAVSVHLEGLNLKVSVPSAYFPVYTSSFVTNINVHDPTATVLNYTTGSLPTDGAMVMSVIQCISTNCTKEAINIVSLFVNFTEVPSMSFSSIGTDYEIGFLVCKPNITIETRQVRTQGSMTLQVQPLDDVASPLPRQGNLDWTQTSLLVSYSMSALTSDSGPPTSAWNGIGSATQAHFIFGKEQMDSIQTGVNFENTSMVIQPLPADQLAQGYTQMVKAAMKPYVTGALGTSYVPGRTASVQQIFVSSLPHVIASTVLIILLLAMAVAAYFRPGKGDQFNLTNLAAALADSELPQTVKRAKIDVLAEGRPSASRIQPVGRRNVGQEVAKKLGDWKVSLKHPDKADGLETLHISRE